MSFTSSIVLLSSGLDSLVSLYWAAVDGQVKLALTFDYGQKAAGPEIRNSSNVSKSLGIKHQVVKIPWLAKLTKTSLVSREKEVPQIRQEDLKRGDSFFKRTAKDVWVPNRNAIFINVAAAYAEGLGASRVVAGFYLEEARSFPDNSREFIAAAKNLLTWSTLSKVEVFSYLTSMTKVDIVKKGVELGVNWKFLWSCYLGHNAMCGRCESCSRLISAFNRAGYTYLLPNFDGDQHAVQIS